MGLLHLHVLLFLLRKARSMTLEIISVVGHPVGCDAITDLISGSFLDVRFKGHVDLNVLRIVLDSLRVVGLLLLSQGLFLLLLLSHGSLFLLKLDKILLSLDSPLVETLQGKLKLIIILVVEACCWLFRLNGLSSLSALLLRFCRLVVDFCRFCLLGEAGNAVNGLLFLDRSDIGAT